MLYQNRGIEEDKYSDYALLVNNEYMTFSVFLLIFFIFTLREVKHWNRFPGDLHSITGDRLIIILIS